MSKIAVVGATGPTGQLVVTEALARGHEVIAYVRRPEALEARSGLTVMAGELNQSDRFAKALQGCDVVISTLGSRSFTERAFMQVHLPMVTSAMREANVTRLVLMSAMGGGEVPRQLHGIDRIIFSALSRLAFGDRTKSEAALSRTGLVWSAVYPAFLTDKAALDTIDVIDVDDLVRTRNSSIPRANVARVLVDLAESSTPRKVVVAPVGKLVGVNSQESS